MKPPERKWPQSRVAGERPAANARQFKPTVAQLKHSAPAGARRQPASPPVYRPQSLPAVLQTKRVVGAASPGAGLRAVSARGVHHGGTIQRSEATLESKKESRNGVVRFNKAKGSLTIDARGHGYAVPAGMALEVGDQVSFDVDQKKVVSNLVVTGQSEAGAHRKKHSDLSSQIDLKTVPITPVGGRVEAHHKWAVTVAELRKCAGKVENTFQENQDKNGWNYKIRFEDGSILFAYNEDLNRIEVFHSFNKKSG